MMTRRETIFLAAVLLLAAAGGLRPSIRGNDGVGHYVYLASLLRDGDLDLANEYREFDRIKQYPYHFADLPVDPRTGRASDRYGIGAALLWSPFVLAVHLGLKILDPAAATAIGRPYEWAVGVGTVFWGSLGLALLYARLRRRWSPLAAGATLAGLIGATPLGFYLYAHGSMSHGASFFALTAVMLAAERAWRRPVAGPMAWCGFLMGLAIITRFQDASWAVVIGLALAGRAWAGRREAPAGWRALAGLAALGLAALASLLPQMAVWHALYGSWFSGPAPYLNRSAGEFTFWPRHLWAALVSERGGALAWHRLLAAGLAGLAAQAFGRGAACMGDPKEQVGLRALAWLGLAGFALQAWLVGCWSMWWGGASFGNRFFISSLPFLALGLAEWAGRARGRRGRAALLVVLAALVAWNPGLLVQSGPKMVPRE
ncbi:MAG: hypothetical protein M1457_11715, partial [bacterium]|nr:hypothetical protein [bacterium]